MKTNWRNNTKELIKLEFLICQNDKVISFCICFVSRHTEPQSNLGWRATK